MSCKPLISAATTNSTDVASGATIPLSSVIRRRGCELELLGNNIMVKDCGSNYYLATITVTFTAPVAGVVTVNLQQNGVNIPSATASTTITTASTEVRSLSFVIPIRTFCGQNVTNISAVNAGVSATFTNVSVSVEKL